jgi:hypothetical protein
MQSIRLSSSMGGDVAALTHPPATQDNTGVVHISRRHKHKLGKESNPGQAQTHKVPPEALTTILGQKLSMWNHHEKNPMQDQMIKVAPEALAEFAAQPVTILRYYENCQVQEQIKNKTLEAMLNYLSIKNHLSLPSISTEKNPRYSSVATNIIK